MVCSERTHQPLLLRSSVAPRTAQGSIQLLEQRTPHCDLAWSTLACFAEDIGSFRCEGKQQPLLPRTLQKSICRATLGPGLPVAFPTPCIPQIPELWLRWAHTCFSPQLHGSSVLVCPRHWRPCCGGLASSQNWSCHRSVSICTFRLLLCTVGPTHQIPVRPLPRECPLLDLVPRAPLSHNIPLGERAEGAQQPSPLETPTPPQPLQPVVEDT